MRKLNIQFTSQVGQTSIDRIECILVEVIFRIQPFFLQLSPKGLGNVQMRRIRRKKKNEQSSILPILNTLLHCLRFMYTCIIQYNECFLGYCKGKIFQMFYDKVRIYVLFGCDPPTLVLSAYKSKAVEFIGLFGKNADILTRKLPTVRHIAFTAHMGFIPIKKVYFSFHTQLLKLFQFFYLKFIMLGLRFALASPSYTFISAAKLFKKILNVLSQTLFPLCCSHRALAVRMRCRLALMAERIASLSSLSTIIGFLPRPGLVCKPEMPSELYRFSHVLTLTLHMPVILPTSFEVRPSDFNNMLWQRIRKQWLLPSLRPSASSRRCSNDKIGVFTRPIWTQRYKIMKTIF